MKLNVVALAQPANVERLRVIVMVGDSTLNPADFAGPASEPPRRACVPYRSLGRTLLFCGGLGWG